MTENERLTIDEIIQHCNITCENTEMLAIARGQNQEDITSKGYWEHYQVANYLEELKHYRAIGTIEELKALKEKSVAKKPTCVSMAKDKDTAVGSIGRCPCCNYIVTLLKPKCNTLL